MTEGALKEHAILATDSHVLVHDLASASWQEAEGLEGDRPTCLAVGSDPGHGGTLRAWCGTRRSGVFRSEDGGRSWVPSGLEGRHLMSLATSPGEPGVLWAGTEPSALWRSDDGGRSWEERPGLSSLPSSSEWAFPPRPDTHHVRWIACHPREPGRLWLAIEAGALISTPDGGRSWRDRVPGGPYDTHELAIHPGRPDTLRVSAGDGYYESHDRGSTWSEPRRGMEVGYLRSVAVDPGDPDGVVVSAASGPRSAYVAGRSDGRIYRRTVEGEGQGEKVIWRRPRKGRPDPPSTIAPLLRAGGDPGELWAADERGLHRTADGGGTWELVAPLPLRPDHLRGFEVSLQARG